MPNGFSTRGVGPFAWTPDSRSLVVGHDSEPFMKRRTGTGSSHTLRCIRCRRTPAADPATAALDRWPLYFNPNAQVAPMFRPPDGDLILSPDGHALNVWDGDLQNATELARQSLDVRWPTWSPDGAMIMFRLEFRRDSEVFVMNPDGADPRSVVEGFSPLWSPDSNSIAFERLTPGPDGSGLLEAGSSARRDCDHQPRIRRRRSPGSDLHRGSRAGRHFIPSPITRSTTGWYYEGWSWSPDGRSLLILESHGPARGWSISRRARSRSCPGRPTPAPSWQRVASG